MVTAHGGRTYLIELRIHPALQVEDLAALYQLVDGWRWSWAGAG